MITEIVNNIHIGTIWDAIHCKDDFKLIICVAEFDNFSAEEQHDLMCQNRTILHAPFMIYGNIETGCSCAGKDKACRKCGGYGTILLQDCKADRHKLSFIARWMAIESNDKILIHCAAGVERSPLAVIYYLWLYKNMPFEKGYDFVKQRRPIIENRLSWLR